MKEQISVDAGRTGVALSERKEGDAHLAAGRYAEGLACWKKLLAEQPDHPHVLAGMAMAFVGLKRFDEATQIVIQLLNAETFHPSSMLRLGAAWSSVRRFDQAIEIFQCVVRRMPANVDALNHLGVAQMAANHTAEAIYNFRRAVLLDPTSAAPHCNMALAFFSLNRIPEAIAANRRALAIEPSSPVAHFNLGCFLLASGEYAEGWAFYRQRFARKAAKIRHEAQPWVGDPLDGKKILILGEQTNGDYVQFIRYAMVLAELGASVSVLAPKRLHRLLSTMPCDVQFFADGVDGKSFDYQCPLFDIPHYLGLLGQSHPPAHISYLKAEPERIAHWRERIGSDGFRIAIAWEGSRPNGDDFGRSFPLQALWPVCQVPGVRLISLQWRSGLEQIAALPPGMVVETLGDEFESNEHGFLDAAAVMACVDLVITLDSALAHVAGATGCPTWIALCHAPEWRWQRERDDSPWYPTVRLFRQGSPGDWDGVFARMADALRDLCDKRRPSPPLLDRPPQTPLAPVSYGEIFDKITILELKERHLGDPDALAKVRFELALLRKAADDIGALGDAVRALINHLRDLNRRLWDVENALRHNEAAQNFGEEFVALARSVYQMNDERAATKHNINMLLHSPIVEQKVYAV